MIFRLSSLIGIAALLGAALTGCGDDAAEASLCDSLGDFRTAVSDLRELDSDSSREEFESARDDVGNALEQVLDDASDLAGVRIDGLQVAFGDLRTAIDNLPEDATIREKLDEIEPELDSVGTAFQALFAGLNCDGE